jgi:transcriptional regulator with XRE-family HTH domain
MVGQELKKAREKAKLTQEDASFAAKMDRSYLSQLENDRKSPTLDMLFRLCKVLNVSASELIARVEEAQKAKRKR